MSKQCSKCKEIKELDQFSKRKESKDGKEPQCRLCKQLDPKRIATAKRWKANNPEKTKSYALKFLYGITLNQKTQMLNEQAHKCPICQRTQDELGRVLVVDHCHKTGRVRALLCDSCNAAVGLVDENVETALQLAQYIKDRCAVDVKSLVE